MKKMIAIVLCLVLALSMVGCSNSADKTETIYFNGKTFNEDDLSPDTIEWLEKYNELSEDEQLSISYIPSDLYELCGYGNATEEVIPTEIEAIDYPPMVMFNDILYSAASYQGTTDNLTLVGEIESYVSDKPTENNQANDNLIGCEIYKTTSAPEYIFVLYNGSYSTYKAIVK